MRQRLQFPLLALLGRYTSRRKRITLGFAEERGKHSLALAVAGVPVAGLAAYAVDGLLPEAVGACNAHALAGVPAPVAGSAACVPAAP